jgi:hypothetical protein
MQARRTYEHGPQGGWSAIAVHLQAAEADKEGFYLTLFPDGRGPTVVFLRPQQLLHLIDLASQSSVSDQQIWEEVSKIPMEPLLPSRSLYPRLRAVLVDCAAQMRTVARAQLDRPVPLPAPIETAEAGGAQGAPTAPFAVAEQPGSTNSEAPLGSQDPSPFVKS